MPTFLADTSIWSWANTGRRPDIASKLIGRLERNEVATCYPVVIEYLHRARSGAEYELLFASLFDPLHWCDLKGDAAARAIEVQRGMALGEDGNHRRPAADYLIAAAAELAGPGVVLWAYDRDLRAICEHTGQPHEIEAAA